jgi:hypothetical protein
MLASDLVVGDGGPASHLSCGVSTSAAIDRSHVACMSEGHPSNGSLGMLKVSAEISQLSSGIDKPTSAIGEDTGGDAGGDCGLLGESH